VLERTSFIEIGIMAAKDINAALDYENRLIDFKKRMEADFNVETRSSNHDQQPEKSML
jgi:hypothetical protein